MKQYNIGDLILMRSNYPNKPLHRGIIIFCCDNRDWWGGGYYTVFWGETVDKSGTTGNVSYKKLNEWVHLQEAKVLSAE